MIIWSLARNWATSMPLGTSSSCACWNVTIWSIGSCSIVSSAVMIFVVLHMETRRWLLTSRSTRPEVTSTKYADDPLTKGGGVGVGDGVGGGVGVSVGVGTAVRVAVDAAGEASAFCQRASLDEKKMVVAPTRRTITRKAPMSRMRWFIEFIPFRQTKPFTNQTWTFRFSTGEPPCSRNNWWSACESVGYANWKVASVRRSGTRC